MWVQIKYNISKCEQNWCIPKKKTKRTKLKKISRNEVENDEHDVLWCLRKQILNEASLVGKWTRKKKSIFCVYIKFDVGIETGKDKENNLIEVISQGINFIILDKISPLYIQREFCCDVALVKVFHPCYVPCVFWLLLKYGKIFKVNIYA